MLSKFFLCKGTFGIAVAIASSQLCASGFAVNEQSVSGMGTGFAGRSSSAEDASTVYGNPAGMALLEGRQVTGGGAFIDASSEISQVGGHSSGSNKGNMVPFTAVPFGFYAQKINERWAVGFGIYAPFGLTADYERDFQGKAFGSKSEVKVVTLQPTFSYSFNERVSLGFGPTINRITGVLESDVTLPYAGSGSNKIEIKGDGSALGYNAGLLVSATDTTRVGLTYHSKVSYKLTGHTEVIKGKGVPMADLNNGSYDASLRIDTPESWDLSITQDLGDWKLYGGSTWTRWSRLKDITVNNEGITYPTSGVLAQKIVGTIKENQNWHDTWAYAVGASYRANKHLVLRTGLTFDQAPTNNFDRSPRIPTGDRIIFSLGVGYDVMPNMTIDVAFAYLKEESVKVNRSNALGQSYSAKYENSANGFGLGATYRF
ncbi:outer membrane protein transport protein [Pseudomonas sp. RC4D1]|uniref:OmpP1/FadL family transporter n=1 Tax=Pseudomonas sp. RC4D1 TaxID=2834407 RepID=UPI001BCC5EF5|nr:outer membrane protein transport protein [Pseudomonas sp. RC4D1]MBS7560119.1 outer membrane protein transport protein [Pseudomonas sp. RC4D1]